VVIILVRDGLLSVWRYMPSFVECLPDGILIRLDDARGELVSADERCRGGVAGGVFGMSTG
jgi:hypothetical protein